MAENTKIQWATHTFNPWRGCTKIAPGCANCYADAQSKRNPGTLGVWGPNGTRVVASEAMWREPIKWNRAAQVNCDAWEIAAYTASERQLLDAGFIKPERPRVFCASLADVFEDWGGQVVDSRGRELFLGDGLRVHWDEKPDDVPIVNLDDVRARLFRLIDSTPNLDWLLLTKRPENVRRMWPQAGYANAGVPGTLGRNVRLDNVWLGTSIACQEDADRNAPELLKCRDLCAKTFLSIEPLIGPVDLSQWRKCECRSDGYSCDACTLGPPDWVIVGGESGPNARPCNIEWIRSIVRQCRDAGVPCFVKQLGAYCLDNDAQSRRAWPLAVPMTLRDDWTRMIYRDPKGGDPDEWPEDLRVREVPS